MQIPICKAYSAADVAETANQWIASRGATFVEYQFDKPDGNTVHMNERPGSQCLRIFSTDCKYQEIQKWLRLDGALAFIDNDIMLIVVLI